MAHTQEEETTDSLRWNDEQEGAGEAGETVCVDFDDDDSMVRMEEVEAVGSGVDGTGSIGAFVCVAAVSFVSSRWSFGDGDSLAVILLFLMETKPGLEKTSRFVGSVTSRIRQKPSCWRRLKKEDIDRKSVV